MSKFEAPSYKSFWDIKFSMTKLAKGDNSTFFLISTRYLLIILYKLSKFEDTCTSCNSFWDIKISMSKFAKDKN